MVSKKLKDLIVFNSETDITEACSVTDTLRIAHVYKKDHHKVLRDLRKAIGLKDELISEEAKIGLSTCGQSPEEVKIGLPTSGESSKEAKQLRKYGYADCIYLNKQNKPQPYMKVTEDLLFLLLNKYTTKEAMRINEQVRKLFRARDFARGGDVAVRNYIKKGRRAFTDMLKAYFDKYHPNAKGKDLRKLYAKYSCMITEYITGYKPSKIKDILGVSWEKLTRSHHELYINDHIGKLEARLTVMIEMFMEEDHEDGQGFDDMFNKACTKHVNKFCEVTKWNIQNSLRNILNGSTTGKNYNEFLLETVGH